MRCRRRLGRRLVHRGGVFRIGRHVEPVCGSRHDGCDPRRHCNRRVEWARHSFGGRVRDNGGYSPCRGAARHGQRLRSSLAVERAAQNEAESLLQLGTLSRAAIAAAQVVGPGGEGGRDGRYSARGFVPLPERARSGDRLVSKPGQRRRFAGQSVEHDGAVRRVGDDFRCVVLHVGRRPKEGPAVGVGSVQRGLHREALLHGVRDADDAGARARECGLGAVEAVAVNIVAEPLRAEDSPARGPNVDPDADGRGAVAAADLV
mmetsp:Transcript_42875/g.132485  ORF Transcript_42875/g.132485 Transcript_42875/m.132485 type:complete len:261 (+) Transcript_42875:151-933(+)